MQRSDISGHSAFLTPSESVPYGLSGPTPLASQSTTSPGEIAAPEGRRHEVLGILSGAATILVGLALWSYDARGTENWIGPVGSGLAGVIVAAFGVAAWVIPVELGLATVRLFSRGRTILGLATVASTLVIVLVGCAMLHLFLEGQTVYGGHLAGGILGEVLGEVLRSLLGLAGAYVVGVAILLVTFVLRTPVSLTEVALRGAAGTRAFADKTIEGARALWDAWREAKELERAEREANAPKIIADDEDEEEYDEGYEEEDGEAIFVGDEAESTLIEAPAKTKKRKKKSAKAEPAAEEEEEEDEDEDEGQDEDAATSAKAAKSAKKARKKKGDDGPRIVAPVDKPRPAAAEPKSIEDEAVMVPSLDRPFVLPPTTLLDAPPPQDDVRIDSDTLRENAARLVEKLEAYGVKGRVDEIHPGPVVTMYEFEPQSGTKISKIAGLADDLAMALAAHKVRIVAPIPGKARVGFELPNEHASDGASCARSSRTIAGTSSRRRTCRWPSARTSRVSRSTATWRRCRTCWWRARPAPARASAST